MIKPPFTIIILKDSKHPVTLRVTNKFVLLLFMFIFIFCGLAIYGTIRYLPKGNSNYAKSISEQKSNNAEYFIIEHEDNFEEKNAELSEPDVKNLSIKQLSNGNIEITFTFAHIEGNNELYVWLILNPEAETIGEMIIYPRSPIFSGFPVDYRNGILYNLSDNKFLKATFSGPMIGIDFNHLRVLAYSLEGNIIVDKSFTIQQNIRM